MAESERTNTASVLAAYRKWKEEGENLKSRAQGGLMDRFAELIREAQQVQHDLLEDFGQVVKFPANPKPGKKGRSRTVTRKAAAPTRPVPVAEPPVAVASVTKKSSVAKLPVAVANVPRERAQTVQPVRSSAKSAQPQPDAEAQRAQLARKIEKAEARLKVARDSGDPVRVQNAEDRVYELKDELRLLSESVL